MEPLLSNNDVLDIWTKLESGKYSKEAAINNIDATLIRISPSFSGIAVSKLLSMDIQILDAILTTLENKIREQRKEIPWIYQDNEE